METNEAPVVPPGDCIFHLGTIEISDAARAAIPETDMTKAIGRHAQGDWGEVENCVRRANHEAFQFDWMIESAFTAESGTKFRVVTRPKGYVTQILLPEEED